MTTPSHLKIVLSNLHLAIGIVEVPKKSKALELRLFYFDVAICTRNVLEIQDLVKP